MVDRSIRQDLKEAGSLLLKSADEAGLCPAAAAWIFDHDLAEWRFYIVSPLVGHVGKSQLYDAIAEIMKGINLPEDFSIVDIYLDDTSGKIFNLIGHAIAVRGHHMMEVRNSIFNGMKVDALIYRFDISKSKADASAVAAFVRSRKRLKKSNERKNKRTKHVRV